MNYTKYLAVLFLLAIGLTFAAPSLLAQGTGSRNHPRLRH